MEKYDQQIKEMLKQLNPGEQAFARTFAQMRVENEMMRENLTRLRELYDELYACLLALLNDSSDREIIIESQSFVLLKHEYRLVITPIPEINAVSLKLHTLTD